MSYFYYYAYFYSSGVVLNSLLSLRKVFAIIEKEHYKIVDSYIKGQLLYEMVEQFENLVCEFRQNLYAYVPLEKELLEVAKMKSKIQHYITEVLEDENLLTMAYKNSC